MPEIPKIEFDKYFMDKEPYSELACTTDHAKKVISDTIADLFPSIQEKAKEIDQEIVSFKAFVTGHRGAGIVIIAYCNMMCDWDAESQYQAFTEWLCKQLLERLKPDAQANWFYRPACKTVALRVGLDNAYYSFISTSAVKRFTNHGPWRGLSTDLTSKYQYQQINLKQLASRLDWSEEQIKELLLELDSDGRALETILVTDNPDAISEGKDVLLRTDQGWLYLDKNSELVRLDSSKQPILMSNNTIDKGSDNMGPGLDNIYTVLYDTFYDERDAAKKLGVDWEDLYGINVAVENAGYGSVWQFLVAKQQYANVLEVNGVDLLEVLEDGSVGRLDNGTFKSCEEEVNRAVEGLISVGLLDKSVAPTTETPDVGAEAPDGSTPEADATEVPEEVPEEPEEPEPEEIPENSSRGGKKMPKKLKTNAAAGSPHWAYSDGGYGAAGVGYPSRGYSGFDEEESETHYGGNQFDVRLPEDWNANDYAGWTKTFPYGKESPEAGSPYRAARSYQDIADWLYLSPEGVAWTLEQIDSSQFGNLHVEGVLVADSDTIQDGDEETYLDDTVLVVTNQGVYSWTSDDTGDISSTFTKVDDSINSSVDASATNAGDIPSKEETVMVNSNKRTVPAKTGPTRRRRRRKLNSSSSTANRISTAGRNPFTKLNSSKLNCSTFDGKTYEQARQILTSDEYGYEELWDYFKEYMTQVGEEVGKTVDLGFDVVADDFFNTMADTADEGQFVEKMKDLAERYGEDLNSSMGPNDHRPKYDKDDKHVGWLRDSYRAYAGEDDDTSDEEVEEVIKNAYEQEDVPIRIAVARAAAEKRKKRGLNSSSDTDESEGKSKGCVNCDSEGEDITVTTESGNEVPLSQIKVIQNPETNELMLYVPENGDDEIPEGFTVSYDVVSGAPDFGPEDGGDFDEGADEDLDSSEEPEVEDSDKPESDEESLNSSRAATRRPAPSRPAPTKKKNPVTRR